VGIEFSSDKNNLFYKTERKKDASQKVLVGAKKKKELRSKKQKENWQQTRKGPWKKKTSKIGASK
jgi:hypothetical protein